MILPHVTRLPLATARKLLEYVKAGGTVVAVTNKPNHVPGYMDRAANIQSLEEIISELFNEEAGNWKQVGKGKTIYIEHESELISRLQEAGAADVKIEAIGEADDQPALSVGYVHRIHQEGHLYFLANVSNQEKKARIQFKYGTKSATVLDPLTNETVRQIQLPLDNQTTSIDFIFEPFQSFMVVFDQEHSADVLDNSGALPSTSQISQNIDITDSWTLRIPEAEFEQELASLQTWEQFDEVKYYCGTAFYDKKVSVPALQPDEQIWIELEGVHEVAEVFVNGTSAGVLWKAQEAWI